MLSSNLEELLGVVLEDHFLFGVAQEFERFDQMPSLIEQLARLWIFDCTNTGAFGPKQVPIRTTSLEEHYQSTRVIQHGVVIQIPHLLEKPRAPTTQRPGFKPSELVRNRATAVGNHDFEIRKIRKHIR